MNILLLVVYAWAAYFVSVMAHELGHFPKKMQIKLLPLPIGRAVDAKSRYGGLVVNGIILSLVAVYRPEHIFLQLLGLASLINVLLYMFVAPFIKQGVYATTINDIEYGNWIAVIIGVAILYLFGSYYLEITKIIVAMFAGGFV